MKKTRKQAKAGERHGASLTEALARQATACNCHSLVWRTVPFGVLIVSIYAFAVIRHGDLGTGLVRNFGKKLTSLSSGSQFGQFPPTTDAERELEKLLRGKDEVIDLALANWLVAVDVPQFSNLTRETYFDRLGAMTRQVRQEMERRRQVAKSRGKNPNDADTRCAAFCGAMIKLGFVYREEFAQHDLTPQQTRSLYADANNTFLPGLLRTKRGSCVSMPLIYAVIGQRLDLPVYLVHVGRHCFVRWQEADYRMNIETTAVDHVWVTDDDSAYLEGERMTNQQVQGNELRNLSNREVVGSLLFIRSSHWIMKADQERVRSWVDLSRALHLSPDDQAIAKTYQAISRHYGLKPDQSLAELERIDRGARAQIDTARADGEPTPINVFGELSTEHGFPGLQGRQQTSIRVARPQLPNNTGFMSQWSPAQQGPSATSGAVRASAEDQGVAPMYTERSSPLVSGKLKGKEHE